MVRRKSDIGRKKRKTARGEEHAFEFFRKFYVIRTTDSNKRLDDRCAFVLFCFVRFCSVCLHVGAWLRARVSLYSRASWSVRLQLRVRGVFRPRRLTNKTSAYANAGNFSVLRTPYPVASALCKRWFQMGLGVLGIIYLVRAECGCCE